MTQTQVAYWQMKQQERDVSEKQRTNVAKEAETHRSNVRKEELTTRQLVEQERAARESEDLRKRQQNIDLGLGIAKSATSIVDSGVKLITAESQAAAKVASATIVSGAKQIGGKEDYEKSISIE